jgi:cardiolipin synthase
MENPEDPWLDYAVQIDDPIIAKASVIAEKRYFSKKNRNCFKYKEKTIVSIIQNDWLKRKNEIYDAILIPSVLLSSYFSSWQKNEYRIEETNKVKIKLILSGMDVTLSRRATYHIYSALLDNNIELYE